MDGFALRSHFNRFAEIPFSSERQLMAVWINDPSGNLQAPSVLPLMAQPNY
ncbi:hypothetical protein AAF134_15020 [Synechococcus lacustris Tous-12m]